MSGRIVYVQQNDAETIAHVPYITAIVNKLWHLYFAAAKSWRLDQSAYVGKQNICPHAQLGTLRQFSGRTEPRKIKKFRITAGVVTGPDI